MTVKTIHTQRVLSPTQITLADYVINPYRGCEFRCVYCYALKNKNVQGNEEMLGIKINAASVLEKELKYKLPKRVLLGSATECFQYKELEYRITEGILKSLNTHKIPYTILTKSHLIAEYLPIIAQNKRNKIYLTLNLHSNELIKMFEKKTPSIEERIKTIKTITAHKIPLRIHIGPFIPYISSLEKIMSLLPESIKEINVELYHHNMGNFTQVLNIIERNFGGDMRNKVSSIYKSRSNYLRFAKALEDEVPKAQNKRHIKLFLIAPDFNDYYNERIDYKDNV